MRRRRLLGLLSVPVIALGLNPGVVHAGIPSTVWKVLIHEENNRVINDGAAVKVQVTYTCPKWATNVVVDLTVNEEPTEGEAESVPVTCKGEAADKWFTVWSDSSSNTYGSGLASVRAVLDWAQGANSFVKPATTFQEGTDMAEDDRTIRLAGGNGLISWVSIQGGHTRNAGSDARVEVDYLCPSSWGSINLRGYVDQDLGTNAEAGSGDAEGLANRTVNCTGHRESTTITVTSGSPQDATPGSVPCEDVNTPAPTENYNDTFTVEQDGGTFATGNSCINVTLGEADSNGDVTTAQTGVFNLNA